MWSVSERGTSSSTGQTSCRKREQKEVFWNGCMCILGPNHFCFFAGRGGLGSGKAPRACSSRRKALHSSTPSDGWSNRQVTIWSEMSLRRGPSGTERSVLTWLPCEER